MSAFTISEEYQLRNQIFKEENEKCLLAFGLSTAQKKREKKKKKVDVFQLHFEWRFDFEYRLYLCVSLKTSACSVIKQMDRYFPMCALCKMLMLGIAGDTFILPSRRKCLTVMKFALPNRSYRKLLIHTESNFPYLAKKELIKMLWDKPSILLFLGNRFLAEQDVED